MILLVGAFLVALPLWHGGKRWLAVLPVSVGAMLFYFCITRASRESLRQLARDTQRLDELDAMGAGHQGTFEIHRAPAYTWPAIVSLFFALAAIAGFAAGEPPIAAVFLLFGSGIAVVSWGAAWLLGRGVIATLTPTGIALRGEEIPWSNVVDLDLNFVPKVETGQLVIRLAQPRAPLTIGQRLGSVLSGGSSDHDVVISLARSREPAAVIFELALRRWQNATGPHLVQSALVAKAREMQRRNRPWRERSNAERLRMVLIVAAILTLLGFAAHGALSHFRPSDAWFFASLASSVAIAVAGALTLARSKSPAARSGRGVPNPIAVFLLSGLALGAASWATLGYSWPDIATRLAGLEATREVAFDRTTYRDRRRCRLPIALHLDEGRPFRLCAGPGYRAEYDALPPRGMVRVQLRESWFGVHIVSLSALGS